MIVPNKANQVGRGLSLVVILALRARRLFECYEAGQEQEKVRNIFR